MHLHLETDDVEAEVQRLETLGARRWDHQHERGFDFWVLRDPWGTSSASCGPSSPSCLQPARPARNRRLHHADSGKSCLASPDA
jgi:hypothetical protein